MNRGILFFAFNNEQIDYLSIALVNALMVKTFMKNNQVAVVTDESSYSNLKETFGNTRINKAFDEIIFEEVTEKTENAAKRTYKTDSGARRLSFHNQNSVTSYVLSPFDETLHLDVDYLIQSDLYDGVWGSVNDVMINGAINKVDHTEVMDQDIRPSQFGIKQLWATAIYFKKNETVKQFYELANFVAENYWFYKKMYQLPHALYRNDYVYAITNHIFSGQIETNSFVKSLPGEKIITAFENCSVCGVDYGSIQFVCNIKNSSSLSTVKDANVHVLRKESLLHVVPDLVKLYG